MTDAEIMTRLADTLVRCGVERGHVGRIDADNVARILLPIVRALQADELETVIADLDDLYETGGAFGAGNLTISVRLDRRVAALRQAKTS